jgi:hypothetical protein
MDFLLGLRFLLGQAPVWQASLVPHPVNVVEACQRHCTQNGDDCPFLKPAHAFELTVPHKTVAELH